MSALLTSVRRRARRLVALMLYEWRLGVRTTGVVQLEDLGVAGRDRTEYQPLEWRALKRVLKGFDIRSEDVFIDFGAGMGRVVLQAAERPFGRVLGVELAEQLVTVAQANVEHRRPHLVCDDVQIVHSDVLDFEIPDDLTFAFFNNPFLGEVFRTVIERVIDSYDRRPRRLLILYRNPLAHDVVMATGRVAFLESSLGRDWRGRRLKERTHIYEVLPARTG